MEKKHGGARAGAGRPRGSKSPKTKFKPKHLQRTEVFLGILRVTKVEMNQLKSRIRKSGLSASEWARRRLLG